MLLAPLLVVGPLAGQEPDADVRGTWVLDDEANTVVSIYDLRDYMPDGSSQLTFFEPTSGLLRTLHPGAPGRWTAGPSWFTPEPVEITVAVDSAASDGRAVTLDWIRDAGHTRARRIDYDTRPISVDSDGVHLAGTLILPPTTAARDSAPHPAVVMIAGSGRATREVPRSVGELFARAGVAAVVYDKRGTGASEGDFASATVADFGRDAAAVVAAAAAHPDIDPRRVGVMVASQGGLLVPAVARRTPDLAFVVCRVCPVLSGAETSLAETRGRLRAAGIGPGAIAEAERFVAAQQRYALTGEGYDAFAALVDATGGAPWTEVLRPGGGPPMAPDADGWRYYRDFLSPDPWAFYETFDRPVLGVFGALDERVPPTAHAEPLRRLLARSGHRHSQVWVLDDATHGLMLGEGDRAGPFHRVVPGWHDRLVEWVVEATAPEATARR